MSYAKQDTLINKLNNLTLHVEHEDLIEFWPQIPFYEICVALISDARMLKLTNCLNEISCPPADNINDVERYLRRQSQQFPSSSNAKFGRNENQGISQLIERSKEFKTLSHGCGRYLLLMIPNLSICFENFDECTIYVNMKDRCFLFEKVDMNELDLVLFILCKLQNTQTPRFNLRRKEESHSTILAPLIFEQIIKALNVGYELVQSKVIQASLNSNFHLVQWGRYAITMPLIPYMGLAKYIESNLLHHYNSLFFASVTKQLIKSEIRTLSFSSIRGRGNGFPVCNQFDLLLRIPIPLMNGKSFTSTTKGMKYNLSNVISELSSRIDDLPTELQLKIFNDDLGFHECHCAHDTKLIARLKSGNYRSSWIQQRISNCNALFPVSKRIAQSSSGNSFMEIYCILLAKSYLQSGFTPTWTKDVHSIVRNRADDLQVVNTLDIKHFNNAILDVNSGKLGANARSHSYENEDNFKYLNESIQLKGRNSNFFGNFFTPIHICDADASYEIFQ